MAGKDKEKAARLDHYYSDWRRHRDEPSLMGGETREIEYYFQSVLKLKREPYSYTPTWYVPGGSGINRLVLGFSEDGSLRIVNVDYCFLTPQELHEVGIECSSYCDHQVWRPASPRK